MWRRIKSPLLVSAIFALEFAAPLLSQTPCSEGGSVSPTVTIHIYNYAQISPRQLTEAEREASRILQDGGIATRWMTCPISGADQEVNSDCGRRLLSSELVLNIMPHQDRAQLRYGDTFGYAQVFTNGQIGHYAFLFWDRAEVFARGNLSGGRLLGGIAAHEIGHLLLGSNAHALRGLMSARWDKDDLDHLSQGRLNFNSLQSDQLRAGLQARCGQFPLIPR